MRLWVSDVVMPKGAAPSGGKNPQTRHIVNSSFPVQEVLTLSHKSEWKTGFVERISMDFDALCIILSHQDLAGGQNLRVLKAIPQQMSDTLTFAADPIEWPRRLSQAQLLEHVGHRTFGQFKLQLVDPNQNKSAFLTL